MWARREIDRGDGRRGRIMGWGERSREKTRERVGCFGNGLGEKKWARRGIEREYENGKEVLGKGIGGGGRVFLEIGRAGELVYYICLV